MKHFFLNVVADFLMLVIPDYLQFCGRAARRFIVLADLEVLRSSRSYSADELNSGLYLHT